MIIPVILAGGSGTRLWPLSRKLYPKQLLPLLDDQTLVQHTVLRLHGLADVGAPVVICNDEYRFMIAEQLQAIHALPQALILEPLGRNTAPAVAVAALTVQKMHPEALLLVLPADHLIQDIAAFHAGIQVAAQFAAAGHLVTFGIGPTGPETGYGYIRQGNELTTPDGCSQARTIARFVEKPDSSTAQAYVESGEYFWNSGMFMFQATTVLNELRRFAPDIVASCTQAVESASVDLDFIRLDAEAFALCRRTPLTTQSWSKQNMVLWFRCMPSGMIWAPGTPCGRPGQKTRMAMLPGVMCCCVMYAIHLCMLRHGL